jgi:uncharacterized protein (TIGR03067 family)
MKRLSIAGIALLLSSSGVLLSDDKDLKEIEGTYSVISLEKGGKAAGKDFVQKMKIRIKGEALTIIIEKEEASTAIKADASKQPHTIDITPNAGAEKGKTFLGIYKLEKGELTLAFVQSGERPKDFTSENEVTLMKLKKEETK